MASTNNQIGSRVSCGYIWMNRGGFSAPSFTFTGSYQELSGLSTAFTLASPSQDFEMTTDGRLKYIGIPTKRFIVDATVDAGVNAYLKLYKNGSPLNTSETWAASYSRIPGFPIDLSTNDYISLWTKASATTTAMYQISLSATSKSRV